MKEDLLIDLLEEAETELKEKTKRMQRMNREYRQTFDRDLRSEIDLLRKDIRRKHAEIIESIYVNMDEFRALHKYFPDLLEVFFEDEFLGKTLSRKKWLLRFQELKPSEVQGKLIEIRGKRMMLRMARKELAKRGRTEVSKQFFSAFPALKGKLKPGMSREEATRRLEDMDSALRREGWLLMIDSSLIANSASRMLGKVEMARVEEKALREAVKEAAGRGTIAEHNAKKKLEAATRRRRKVERKLSHLLLANPRFLKELKKIEGFKKKFRPGSLEDFARGVKMKTVKEKPWLEHMKKKLS